MVFISSLCRSRSFLMRWVNRWEKSSSSGFTLVEMMVVVAIVGILSAIAIPSYQRQIAKGRQTEAKVALASMASAEMAYRADTQNFTGCIRDAGFTRVGSQLYYAVGFAWGDIQGCGNCNRNNEVDYSGTCALYDSNGKPAGVCDTAFSSAQSKSNPWNWEATTFVRNNNSVVNPDGALHTNVVHLCGGEYFEARARGSISDRSDSLDEWTINQQNNLVNTQAGF